MSIQRKECIHRIYLLTVWREESGREDGGQDDEEQWRFLLEDPRTGKRKGFAGIQALVDGLLDAVTLEPALTDQSGNPDSAPSPGG